MKKIFITIAALMCVAATATAQTLVVVEEKPVLTNKRGMPILPKAGDIGLGVSVNPLFDYIKYIGRDAGPDSPTFQGIRPSIYAKFFTADNQAIRLGVNLDFGTDYYYGNVLANGNADATVRDMMKDSRQGAGLSIGYEWRRGQGRVQGFWGLEAAASYSRVKTTYTYGNDMTTDYPNPYSWDFNLNSGRPMSSRILENAGATNLQVGLFGFIGVEYFIAPKISIGGEFNLGIVWNNQGESDVKRQYYSSTDNSVKTETTKVRDHNNPNDGLNLRTKTAANIALMFYF